jgi:hypothetical protein
MIRRVGSLILALLRELADENAYKRYLNGRSPTGAEWRKFSEMRHKSKFMRAKCC